LGISPRTWQEEFLRVALGQDVLVLTARQIGKTTAAALAIAHTAIFKPGSLTFEPRRVKSGVIRVYTVGRSHLFDTLHRELHDNKVRILDGATGRRAYEQLTMLEMDYRKNGTIYGCPSARHDDLAISCAILVWASQHPDLEYWARVLEPRNRSSKRPKVSAAAWT
jgi:hypothetical protein